VPGQVLRGWVVGWLFTLRGGKYTNLVIRSGMIGPNYPYCKLKSPSVTTEMNIPLFLCEVAKFLALKMDKADDQTYFSPLHVQKKKMSGYVIRG